MDEFDKTLTSSLAKVGIIALVDEATGYQYVRDDRALATLLEKYIAKDLQPWAETFPYEFYAQIFRLRNWVNLESVKRPSQVGEYANDFVFARVAPGVLDELRRASPTKKGHPKLREHLAAVTALMRAAPNWGVFKRSLERAFPKLNEDIPLPLDD